MKDFRESGNTAAVVRVDSQNPIPLDYKGRARLRNDEEVHLSVDVGGSVFYLRPNGEPCGCCVNGNVAWAKDDNGDGIPDPHPYDIVELLDDGEESENQK